MTRILYLLPFLLLASLAWPFEQKAKLQPIVISDTLTVTRIAPRTWVHTSLHRMSPGGPRFPANGLLVVGEQGAVLVDTPWGEAETAQLLDWADTTLDRLVTAAYLTHFHDDSIDGVPVLKERGIPFFAAAATLDAWPDDLPRAELLTGLADAGNEVDLGALRLMYPGPAHSRDNIVAWVPDDRVVFGGCAVRSPEYPGRGNVADGDIGRWSHSIARVKERYADARIVVPGHGVPGTPELLDHTIELFDYAKASIPELQAAMESGQATAASLVDFYLQRIDAYDRNGPELNSIAHINPRAHEEAEALDRERQQGHVRGPLHGIPILVKDNYETRGMPTTAGSKALEGFAPDHDAGLVKRLRAAGAIILGKTNMHEFAYGIESWGSAFGRVRNPYDPSRNAGGSSGGTGAAVAAGFAAAGLGSDTCGSIRIPSAHNALVGLRGTQGASSRAGIIPLSTTQDIGGPMARSAHDLALLLDVTVGPDPDDPQTAASAGRFDSGFPDALNPQAFDGRRIGIVSELRFRDQEDEDVARVFDRAMGRLNELGAETVLVSLPILNEEIFQVDEGFYLLQHDFGRDLDAYLASRPEAPVRTMQQVLESALLIPQVQERFWRSVTIQNDPPEVYRGERDKRARLKTAILDLMDTEQLDALAYPTIRRIAADVSDEQTGDNCHLSANSGLPAITVPAGFVEQGLPVGLELLGRPWADIQLLGLAYAFEQATMHRRQPRLQLEEEQN